jgi:molybdenum cofactor sulfurtransferase
VSWLDNAFVPQMGHVCWDGNDIIDGRPICVVRASFGFITRRCDIDAMINVLRTFYFTVLTDEPVERGASSPLWVAPASLGAITVYPVKSCNGFSALQWPLGPCGLLYDREWCITDAKGLALTQKAEPKLVSIHASVDRDTSTLSLWSDGFDSITIAIAPAEHSGSETASGASPESVDVTVCGEECRGIPIRNTSERASAVNAWLSRVLDRPAMLVRRMHATEAEKG